MVTNMSQWLKVDAGIIENMWDPTFSKHSKKTSLVLCRHVQNPVNRTMFFTDRHSETSASHWSV